MFMIASLPGKEGKRTSILSPLNESARPYLFAGQMFETIDSFF